MVLEETLDSSSLAELTANIISAFVSNNSVQPSDLPRMIRDVHAALSSLQIGHMVEPRRPAVPISQSITPEYLISLEDGRSYKALKGHLSALGITPVEYRAKWGLPGDYPMVAAEYSARRSEIAKNIGLGRKGAVKAITPETELLPATEPKKRGRKLKSAA